MTFAGSMVPDEEGAQIAPCKLAARELACKKSNSTFGLSKPAEKPQLGDIVQNKRLGDIVQNKRSGNKFNYDFARTHSAHESHSAIVVELGVDHDGHYLMPVGGNESDSIRGKLTRLNNNGLLIQQNHPYICVIQDLK